MQTPLRITYRNVDQSDAIDSRIRQRVDRLERLYDRITSCHVVVDKPHRHGNKGKIYEVRVLLDVPGKEIAVYREGRNDHAHEDVYVALRDAFDATERRLEDFDRKRDHRTRVHEVPPHGRVVRVFPQDGYGFVESSDGLEVYFHENSVVDGRLQDLDVGAEVRYELAPHEGEQGPQASTVRPIGKHHLVG
jgi:ribosomal subunit interface protein